MGAEDHETENMGHVHRFQGRCEEDCFLRKEQHVQWSGLERVVGLAIDIPMIVSRTGMESRAQWRRVVIKNQVSVSYSIHLKHRL